MRLKHFIHATLSPSQVEELMNLGIKDISTDKRNFSIANTELYEAALPILKESDDFRLAL